MKCLLASYFTRMGKSRAFWVCTAAIEGLALWHGWREFGIGPDQSAQDRWATVLFAEMHYELPCILGIFAALYLGEEYEGGALRNKLIAGHGRWAVYGAALAAVSAAAWLMAIAYTGISALLCWLAHGPMPDPSRVPVFLAAVLLVCLAWSTLFTAIGLNCTRPYVSAVVCLAAVGVLLVASARFLSVDIILQGNGPDAAVSRFFYNLLPSGKGDQLRYIGTSNLADAPETLMPYSALFTVLAVAAGMPLFWRRDLK